MKEHGTKQAAGAQKTETPGGDYAPKRDDGTQMGVNAHAALPSQFARVCGFLDRTVETCPMRRARRGYWATTLQDKTQPPA